jgi:4-amino-4-deoxy-L-arabinose transferase-like glycosyltransferase
MAAAWLNREVPGLDYRFNFLALSLATLLTLMWIVVVARSLRSNRRALVNWTSGITMVWMLLMTLGLPAIDHARSYRGLGQKLVENMPGNIHCIARQNVGDAQRALLDYFINLQTVRADSVHATQCRVLLVQGTPLRVPDVGPQWQEIWRGARPGDRTELFVLYERR